MFKNEMHRLVSDTYIRNNNFLRYNFISKAVNHKIIHILFHISLVLSIIPLRFNISKLISINWFEILIALYLKVYIVINYC